MHTSLYFQILFPLVRERDSFGLSYFLLFAHAKWRDVQVGSAPPFTPHIGPPRGEGLCGLRPLPLDQWTPLMRKKSFFVLQHAFLGVSICWKLLVGQHIRANLVFYIILWPLTENLLKQKQVV